MRTLFNRRPKEPGLVPGSLVHAGEKRTGRVRITVMDYDDRRFEEREVERIEDCAHYRDTPSVTWINIDGVHDVSIVEKIGTLFGIHPLLLEDILHTEQRPKMEDFQTYVYIVLRMLYFNGEHTQVDAEQISILVGGNFVITFQEREGDIFDVIRERIRTDKGRIRKMAADYLAYSLMDVIVDNYFLILETLGEKIEDIEEELVSRPDQDTLRQLHSLKRDMIFLRKSIWPLREVVSRIERGDLDVFHDATRLYLRDLYDHTIQVIDTIEGFRDTLSSMLDIYLSSISNRMNEVMKVLTIIATIFIPLTFISGVYGMNFDFMPETKWRYGYFVVLAFMISVAVVMLSVFRRKKWL